MARKPSISVCIPNYNYGRYLPQTINSVLNQKFGDFEVLVIDNRSEDNSVDVVKRFEKKDKRVRLIINERNVGMAGNWNKCLEHASGEFLLILNADDFLHPGMLQKLHSAAQKHNADITFCDRIRYIEDKNRYSKSKSLYKSSGIISYKKVIKDLFTRNKMIMVGSFLVKRKIINTRFNEKFRQIGDMTWLMKLLISLRRDPHYIKKSMLYFRVHSSNIGLPTNPEKYERILRERAMEYGEIKNAKGFSRMKWLFRLYKPRRDVDLFIQFVLGTGVVHHRIKDMLRNWSLWISKYFNPLYLPIYPWEFIFLASRTLFRKIAERGSK